MKCEVEHFVQVLGRFRAKPLEFPQSIQIISAERGALATLGCLLPPASCLLKQRRSPPACLPFVKEKLPFVNAMLKML